MQRQRITVDVEGKTWTFETGLLANQANGAVTIQVGNTLVLATACASSQPSPEVDFLPLRVDYQEKFSSSGKTPGGFIKREGKPSERETLVCRLIDRPLRPMFADGYFNEVQVLSLCLSYDQSHSPDILAICAASAALIISDIPFQKPIAAVRVGRIEDQWVINPSFEQQKNSSLDLVLAGTEEAILMIEGSCNFLTETQVLEAIERGHGVIRTICRTLKEWKEKVGKPKATFVPQVPGPRLLQAIRDSIGAQVAEAFLIPKKQDREEVLSALYCKAREQFLPEASDPDFSSVKVQLALKQVSSNVMREMILKDRRRADGRGVEEIRPITILQGILPCAHGSSLFTRGETQALAVCTLGGSSSGQRYEDLHGEGTHRFFLQYTFPPFSVGEVGRMGAPGRREIGHGKLAERALSFSIPSIESFPYTIRVESTILACNGSSSMASVCGGCLALMDAGVPISRPVAGIAMGLILQDQQFVILSDILGTEDALGDMDLKVAGDREGITAFQMDIKVEGITQEILKQALSQAFKGRIHILEAMLSVSPSSKSEVADHAPRIETLQIARSLIGKVIGPGGKQIREIIETTGAEIDIDESGTISITARNADSMQQAKEMIRSLTAPPAPEVEVGKIYTGKIASVVDFGCFIEINGREYLCHVSELAHERIKDPRELFKVGQPLEVKVIGTNDRGQIKLSRKVLLPKPVTAPPTKTSPSTADV